MKNAMDEKMREDLEVLDKRAELAVVEARQVLDEGVYAVDGQRYQRNAAEAVALALLAIERRLAMLTSFVLCAMDEDEEATT